MKELAEKIEKSLKEGIFISNNEIKEFLECLKLYLYNKNYDFNNKSEKEIYDNFNSILTNNYFGDCLLKHLNYERNAFIYELSINKPKLFHNGYFNCNYCANPPRTLKIDKKYNEFLIEMPDNSFNLLFKFLKYSKPEIFHGLYTKLVIDYFDKISLYKNNEFFIKKIDDFVFLKDNYEDLSYYTTLLRNTIYGSKFNYFFKEIETDTNIFRVIDEEKVKELFNSKEEIKEILKTYNSNIYKYLVENDCILKYISKDGDYTSFSKQLIKDLREEDYK